MSHESVTSSAARSIVEAIKSYRQVESKLPVTQEDATVKLVAKAFDQQEISERRQAFTTNEEIDRTAVLANYELLHGVKYLDKLKNRAEHSVPARAIVAIFRGAEVCLQNLSVLAPRVVDDLRAGKLGDVSVKMTWANHFNDTLYRLSQLLVQIDQGEAEGDFLSIRDSSTFQSYSVEFEYMHEELKVRAGESLGDLAEKDIDDPQRFSFFHSYVNTNYETIWLSIFDHVRLPGALHGIDEDGPSFYERIVQDGDVREAVSCVDLKDSTYLMQFRAYHQISEILVGLVNEVAADIILTLADRNSEVSQDDARALAICNKLLQVVTDNIKPIVRTLSPKAYFAIRPALGITSGSHSHNLRRGLFLTIYPLLVKSLRLNLADFNEALALDDEAMLQLATLQLRKNGDVRAEILRNVVYVHQYVRTWRDEHIQFVKTQIGVSPEDMTPTASISGAENAAATANNFRGAHKSDAIAPLYQALLGKRPPQPFPIVQPGGFDEYMAHFTAEAVQTMYAEVQARAQRKRPAETAPVA